MSAKQKWVLLLLASICLSLAMPLSLGGLSQFRLLQRLSWGAIILLTLMKVISWLFNALRTHFLMRCVGQPMGFLDAALTTISAEFTGVTTPGAMGMAATYTFLFHRLGLGLGRAVGVVGIIMVTDLALYGTIMPLAALLQLLRGPASPSGLRLSLLCLAMVAGGAYLFWTLVRHHRRVWIFLGRQMGRFPGLARWRWRLGRLAVQFLQAVRFLGQMSRMQRLALYLITLDYWLPRYLILVMVVDMVGQAVPSAYLLMVQAVLHLSGQASFVPGGAGSVEAGYASLMGPFMGPEAIAFTLLVWRTYSFYWYVIVGGPIFLLKAGKAAWDLLGKRA